jgi:hypothetical protein
MFFPLGCGSEHLPLGPSPPHPAGKLVEVEVHLAQVHAKLVRKSAMSRHKKKPDSRWSLSCLARLWVILYPSLVLIIFSKTKAWHS